MNAGEEVTGCNCQGEDDSGIIETQPSDPGKNSFSSVIAISHYILARIWKLSLLMAVDLVKGIE
jgi:hypothetical protein